ncbi:hypothetical protein [Streptomyces orinoci]|uniref:Uncharacterized protein n=1 Tax=Streptomyces orinoci TaxID=67339 RepID=A0ABV3K0U1_STRON|nr:hypothetical protein [Streptomyces orinoci]
MTIKTVMGIEIRSHLVRVMFPSPQLGGVTRITVGDVTFSDGVLSTC